MARADGEDDELRDDGVAPVLDDADHALIAKLRALPGEGEEPDWRQLEAQIRAQVAPLATPSPWWRNWRWLVPIGALATTAAIVLVLASRPHGTADVASSEHGTRRDASVATEPSRDTREGEPATHEGDVATAPTMWLDGEAVDVDEISDEDLEIEAAGVATDAEIDPGSAAHEESDPADHEMIGGMLPASDDRWDDRWIDSLDDDEAARLEQFLARKRT